MGRITLGQTSVSSMTVQRNFNLHGNSLARTFDTLSSGMRINRASDDAAGLAIASNLQMESRIYAQGIRNLNDGISYLSIAESTLREMSNIVLRIKELAEQSANGVISNDQRSALDQEAQALRSEYSRIIHSASFNGEKIFKAEGANELVLQAGFGVEGQSRIAVGGNLLRSYTFEGTFEYAGSLPANTHNNSLVTVGIADLNGNGINDIVSDMGGSGQVMVYMGNGDGTFQSGQTYSERE
jgi:flagellin-like hook-associated protein FlgL